MTYKLFFSLLLCAFLCTALMIKGEIRNSDGVNQSAICPKLLRDMANLTEAGWSTEELNAILVISPENCAFRGEGNSNIVVALKKVSRSIFFS